MSREESSEGLCLYRSVSGPCPYLEGKGPWETTYFLADSFDPGAYETMLESGWRRSGAVFYRNECAGCSLCIPMRVGASAFEPSPSQKRCARRNADIELELSPLEFREDRYRLYRRYLEARHAPESGPEGTERNAYARFLLETSVPGAITDYYLRSEGRRILVGNGYLDVLPNGLSSVYYAFDPEHCRRSLGVFSVLREIGLCADMGKQWYYLGFWVPGARKMAYKARFKPHQTAPAGSWRATEEPSER